MTNDRDAQNLMLTALAAQGKGEAVQSAYRKLTNGE